MRSRTVESDSAGSERDILLRLRQGDRRGVEKLMDRYGEDLMRYLAVILGNWEGAEDAFQDTWVKLMERIGRYDLDRPFAPWLFRVARNCAYDQLRRQKRWWPIDVIDSLQSPGEAPPKGGFDETLAANDLSAKLLAGLAPKARELVWLRFYEELSYEEIAERCGVRLGTVKSGLRRALDRMALIHKELEAKDDVHTLR